jgi:hypothetical protein
MRFSRPSMPTRKEDEDISTSKNPNPKIKKTTILLVLGVLIVLILAGVSFYFWRQSVAIKNNPDIEKQKEIAEVVAEVGKLIFLPEGEDPTVATVSDVEKLRNQIFFKNAKNGDKVLIYTKAGKAILYDPVAGKLIEVAHLNSDTNTIANP